MEATAREEGGDAPSAGDRLFYWPCVANLRATSPDDWLAETGPPDGLWCIRCGWPVQLHYAWEVLAVNVMGKSIGLELTVVPMLVVEWTGCPD